MESISLVPSTPYDNSIYIADRKNCDGGLIMLEDRIIDYYMDVQETTAVSVDMSLLHLQPSSTIQFNLIVYSTGNNVLNLSGFTVEQIQVLNGKSTFTIMKGVGDAYWTIQMKSSDTRPEKWLRCSIFSPFIPVFNQGMFNYFNLCYNATSANLNMFLDYAPGQTATNGAYGLWNRSTEGYICAKFPMPVWIKSVCIGVTTDKSKPIARFPISLQIYGTNDGVEWTQILNTSLNPQYGSVDTYMCTTTNYYTMFKFVYEFGSNADLLLYPSTALSGFSSELINTGAYSMSTPYSNTLPLNGYNIETNSSQMSSTGGSIVNLTQFYYERYYTMTRNTDVPFEYIFTFSEAIRTIGFMYQVNSNYSIKLFSLSYSDDKTNWTEYCKVDGTLEAWNQGFNTYQRGTYFCDSVGEHKYYKITVYSNSSGSNTLSLCGLGFIQFQKGHYFTFESFVPKLSSNTQAGYMLIASSASDGDAYKMFDQSVTTYGGGAISDGQWSLLIQLPEATVVRGLEMVSPTSEYNRMPYAFSLQGSQDNDTWTNIKSFLLGSNYWSSANQLGQWDVENETAYKYYRLVVTNTAQGSYVRIGELGLSSYASFKGINWCEEEYLVPVMSANSQNGYVVSASSNYSGMPPWKAFNPVNSSNNDTWTVSDAEKSNANKECNTWIQIQLPEAKAANALRLVARSSNTNTAPKDFTLKASNDGDIWTTLLTQADQIFADKIWTFDNSTTYLYYKLEITKINLSNSYTSIGYIQFIYRRTYYNTLEGE